MKAYRGSRSIAPFILNLSRGLMWGANFMLWSTYTCYPLDRRLGKLHIQFWKEKIFCSASIQTPTHPGHSLGAVPTILSWLCLLIAINNKTVLTGMYSGRPSAMFSWAISAFNFFLWFGFFMPIAVRSCKRTNASIIMCSVIPYPVSDIFNIMDIPEKLVQSLCMLCLTAAREHVFWLTD